MQTSLHLWMVDCWRVSGSPAFRAKAMALAAACKRAKRKFASTSPRWGIFLGSNPLYSQASLTHREWRSSCYVLLTVLRRRVQGVCSRGDKCKYSHDLATIVHFNSKEKGICFDYLRNQCHRGLLCRFSHDLSNIAQQCQVKRHPCIFATRAPKA